MAHPTIERIRQARPEISREAGSLEGLVQRLQAWEQEHPDRMIDAKALSDDSRKKQNEATVSTSADDSKAGGE